MNRAPTAADMVGARFIAPIGRARQIVAITPVR
jgi:hypothetical protein